MHKSIFKSLFILFTSLLITAACGTKKGPLVDPKLTEDTEGAPESKIDDDDDDDDDDDGERQALKQQLEKLKAHQAALKGARISPVQLKGVFLCWMKSGNTAAGPLVQTNRDRATIYAVLNTIIHGLPSLTDLIQTDLNEGNAAATVKAITEKVTYEHLKNDGYSFFNGSNGYRSSWLSWKQEKYAWQGDQAMRQPFIDYMKALKDFAEAAPFSE